VAKAKNLIFDHRQSSGLSVEKIDNTEITTDKPWQIPADDPARDAGYSKYTKE
jgi:hypothetical protein